MIRDTRRTGNFETFYSSLDGKNSLSSVRRDMSTRTVGDSVGHLLYPLGQGKTVQLYGSALLVVWGTPTTGCWGHQLSVW